MAPVEPISDIVERLRFYSREPSSTQGDGQDGAAPDVGDATVLDGDPVEDPGSPTRATDAD